MSLGYIGNEIPDVWKASLLTDLVTPKQWKTISTKNLLDEGYGVYGANGKIGFYSTYTHIKPTLMITCRGATCGNLHISDPYSYINGNAMALDGQLDDFVGVKLLYYGLKARGLRDTISGSAQPQITGQGLRDVYIPLPPLAEQKVIADKLDSLLAQVETTKARLDRIPKILKRFRQSVLAAAVSGRLTEEWRAGKTLDAKKDLFKELEFNTEKEKKVEPTSSHETVVGYFAKDWGVTTFSKIYRFIDYRGKTPKKSEHGKRLYTAKNIKMGFVSDDPVEYLSNTDYLSWMTRGFSKQGDIFFVTEGHTMGCTAINNIGSDIALAQRTLTLQPYGKVETRFHSYYMMTSSFQKLVGLNATGSAAKGIKAAKFRGLPLPFPSYLEQAEIVRRVEELFAYADAVEQKAQAASERVNNLTQSILAKAFRGELTKDWRAANPDLISGENSAEALLEKIKLEREVLKPKKRTKKVKG